MERWRFSDSNEKLVKNDREERDDDDEENHTDNCDCITASHIIIIIDCEKINIAGCVEIICGIERENVASSVAMRRRGGRFAKDSRWSAFCVEKQGKGSD